MKGLGQVQRGGGWGRLWCPQRGSHGTGAPHAPQPEPGYWAGAALRDGAGFEAASSSCRCEARRQLFGTVSLWQSFRESPGKMTQAGGNKWVLGAVGPATAAILPESFSSRVLRPGSVLPECQFRVWLCK